MDWFKMAYTVLGGLGIFFFGMKTLSESLQSVAGDFLRKVVNSLTTNRIMAVIVGLTVTCIVQSSSITTVMVVGFVNAGLMNLAQAIGVIFGANIGTTITGWIISLKVGKYGLLFVGAGVFASFFTKNERLKQIGRLSFALGFIFFGLSIMSDAFKPLRTNDGFIGMMTYLDASSYFSLLAAAGIGCLLTFVIQSSSAMLAITIALASTGAITFQTALALVLGENVGTTITALLAGVGGNTTAKRAALAHAVFNVLGVFVITSVFWTYLEFIEELIPKSADFVADDGSKPYIAQHIAMGHSVFNVANVILFLPFLKYLEKLVIILIPDKQQKEEKHLEFLGNTSTGLSATMAIEQAYLELNKMSDMVQSMFDWTKSYIIGDQENKQLSKQVRKYEEITDNIQKEVTLFMNKVMELPLSSSETHHIYTILRMADELESIADYCDSIVRYAKKMYNDNSKIDKKTKADLLDLISENQKIYSFAKENIGTPKDTSDKDFVETVKKFNSMADNIKLNHLERVRAGKYPPLVSLTLSDIAVSYRRIKNHSVNLAEAQESLS